MNARSFLATTGRGLARAHQSRHGTWRVESLLADQDVRCLAADPLQPNVVYAGTQGNGVLRSDDGGSTWEPAGLQGMIVKSLAVSRVEPGTVYAGTKPPLVFVSRDGGSRWTELDAFRRIRSRRFWLSPAEPPFVTAYVQAIALSPLDPDVILAGIEAGAVVRSSDGGRTWSGHRRGALRDCHSLMFHATHGDWVYEAGGSGGGAAVSHDAGDSWSAPKAGMDRHYGWGVAADAVHPDVWYVSASRLFVWSRPGRPAAHIDGHANAYIFRSIGGASWEKLDGGLPQPLAYMAYMLVTDSIESGHLYAGLSNGDVWYSANYGDSWQRLPFSLGAIERQMLIGWS